MPHEKPLIESKQSFYFGLAVGVAAVSLLGLLALSGNYLKQTGSDDGGAGAQPTPNGQAANKGAGDQGARATVKVDKNDHIRGNKNAKVTIVEFSDIQCPFCARFHETMKQALAAYPNDVRWVFKHFPLDALHPYARKAAEASECAGEQNKFWEYVDTLYANQDKLSDDYLKAAAQELGLDINKFSGCLAQGKYKAKVDADYKYGQSLGVRGTPGSFINGQSVPGAVPFSTLDEMIKANLK